MSSSFHLSELRFAEIEHDRQTLCAVCLLQKECKDLFCPRYSCYFLLSFSECFLQNTELLKQRWGGGGGNMIDYHEITGEVDFVVREVRTEC